METESNQTPPRARAEDKTVAALLDSIFDQAAALRDLGHEPPLTMPGFETQFATDPQRRSIS